MSLLPAMRLSWHALRALEAKLRHYDLDPMRTNKFLELVKEAETGPAAPSKETRPWRRHLPILDGGTAGL